MVINSINDLNMPNLENCIVVLLLNANKENYKALTETLEFVKCPELIVCLPENNACIEQNKRKMLQEINERCKKRPVVSTDSIIAFQIINGRANFRKKRAINVQSALKLQIVNDVEELINLIVYTVSKSFEDLDKEIKTRIDPGKRDISVSLEYNHDSPIYVSPKVSYSREVTAAYNKIVSI